MPAALFWKQQKQMRSGTGSTLQPVLYWMKHTIIIAGIFKEKNQ
jgi:hypothetical protein